MYISKIELKNIRCFEDGVIDLEDKNGNCPGCVVLGENGLGKTTILRSIALSLAGKASGSGLLDQIGGGWIRNEKKEGHVFITLKSDDKKQSFKINTSFGKENGDTDIVSNQEILPYNEGFWEKIFVCGYGATRGLTGETQYPDYTTFDALFTLFTPEGGYLQNPELNIRRIEDFPGGKELQPIVLNWIDSILMLPKGSLELKMGGLFLKDRWGRSMPVGDIADGYKAMLIMICDLIGWALLYDKKFKGNVKGIVMIDEIEQHLHPIWQSKIISILQETFPKVQFILTTHSPLIAGNAGYALNGKGLKLIYTGKAGNKADISIVDENLSELDCDQILSSEAFGYISSINPNIEQVLMESSILAGKDKRSADEEKRLNDIKSMLSEVMFPKGKTLIERVVEREYYTDLEKQVDEFKKRLHKGKSDKN